MRPQVIAAGGVLVEIMRLGIGQPLDRPGEFRGPFASGALAIFAVAAARLGASVGFGGVGDDAFWRLLRARLEAEGVDATQIQVVPGHTTGDCFNAACVVGLEAGWPPEWVAHFACAAGALAVTRLGPMEAAPTRPEVETLMASSGDYLTEFVL